MAWEVGQQVYHTRSYRVVGEVAVVEKVYKTGHAVVAGQRFNENGRATGDWGYGGRPSIEPLAEKHLIMIERHKLHAKAMRCIDVLQKGLSVGNANLTETVALLEKAVEVAIDPRPATKADAQ